MGRDAPEEAARCIEANVDPDDFVDALARQYQGDPEAEAAIVAAFETVSSECAEFLGG